MKVVLAGLLLLLCAGCGGRDDDGGERLAVYHLEAAIGAPGENGQLRCGPPQAVCPGVVEQPPPRAFRYPLLEGPALTDDDVDRSSAHRAEAETGESVVLVRLTPRGRGAFARLTKVVARVGERDQAWHHLAVVVGDEILAFPEVDFDVYPNGILDAPHIRIATPTEADARRLARRVRGG